MPPRHKDTKEHKDKTTDLNPRIAIGKLISAFCKVKT